MTRVDLGTAQPATYKAMLELHRIASKAAHDAGISGRLTELIKIRASQLNGCAFCLRMHTANALKLGESAERLAVLPAWRETTGYFSDADAAGLEIAEYVTMIATAELPDDIYEQIATTLSAEQIAAAHWLAIVINAFNRIAIASHVDVSPA